MTKLRKERFAVSGRLLMLCVFREVISIFTFIFQLNLLLVEEIKPPVIKHRKPRFSIIFSRNIFFACVFVIAVSPFVLYKIVWIAHSKTTKGVVGFLGREYSGQFIRNYAVIRFYVNNKLVWLNGNDNDLYKPGEIIGVRYSESDPGDARINNFVSVWGDTIVFGGLPALVILIVYLHPVIVPRKNKISLALKKPYFKLLG